MADHGTLHYCEEAQKFIDQVEDPVTRTFLNMAFVQLVQKSHLEKQLLPRGDFDMLYFVQALKDFFAEHEVLARTLAGEKVGAWFEE